MLLHILSNLIFFFLIFAPSLPPLPGVFLSFFFFFPDQAFPHELFKMCSLYVLALLIKRIKFFSHTTLMKYICPH